MRALLVNNQYGWIVAWAVALILLAHQGSGTALFIETLLLLSLLSMLVFLVLRTLTVLAFAVVAIISIATWSQFVSRLTY